VIVGNLDSLGVPGDLPDKEMITVDRVAKDASTALTDTKAAPLTTSAGGKVTITGGSVVYAPPTAGLTGADTFYATVTDGELGSNRAMITVYPQPVKNGGFENCLQSNCRSDSLGGDYAPWTFPAINAYTYLWRIGSGAHTGQVVAQVGVYKYGDPGTVAQALQVPSTGPHTLTVWYKHQSGSDADTVAIRVVDGSNTQVLKTLTNATSNTWQRADFDLSAYAGKQVSLQFAGSGANDGSSSTWWIDDVSLN
jgi:hypothetical protein